MIKDKHTGVLATLLRKKKANKAVKNAKKMRNMNSAKKLNGMSKVCSCVHQTFDDRLNTELGSTVESRTVFRGKCDEACTKRFFKPPYLEVQFD